MKPLTRIIEFVLQQAEGQPPSRRIGLYRDLAQISGTAQNASDLNALANELQAIELRHQQLVLDFKRRTNGGTAP